MPSLSKIDKEGKDGTANSQASNSYIREEKYKRLIEI